MAEAETITTTIEEKANTGGENQSFNDFVPSDKEKNVVSETFQRFSNMQRNRDQNHAYLDNRSIIQYIDDNVRRFVTNIDERDDIEDWQARVFDPFTRNKVIAVLGKVSKIIPVPEFTAIGFEDFKRELILTDLFNHAENVDDSEEFMFYILLEAAVKGTAIGYEGYEEKIVSIRDIKEYHDGTDITLKEGKKITRRLRSSLVPLEDFYPSSVGIRKIKDMPDCVWRSLVPFDSFKQTFNQYEKAEFVSPIVQIREADETDIPFFKDYISKDTPEDMVEVIRYYNQDTDEYIILANGLWLNPLTIKGKEEVMPLPFNHKQLPFWNAIYEPFGGDFFYGKSLPDKIKGLQDVMNVLHNMMLDQSFLSIFPPILVEGIDEIEDDILRPGRRIEVGDAGSYKTLDIQTPQGFHQYIIEYTKSILEETSVDAVSQGIAGTGDRTTATEIQTASDAVAGIIGLFVQFVKFGIKDRARLRAQNIFQFYTGPLSEQVLGEGGSEEFGKAFNTFKIEDTVLTSGKRGTKIIEMFKTEKEMPTKVEQRTKAAMAEKETGKRIERVAISPQYIRQFEFDIRLIANPKQPQSKALDKALLIEKARVYLELMPEFIDKEELAIQIAEAFGDRPERIIKKQVFQPEEEGVQGGGLGVTQNMVGGIQGNEKSGMNIKNLAAASA